MAVRHFPKEVHIVPYTHPSKATLWLVHCFTEPDDVLIGFWAHTEELAKEIQSQWLKEGVEPKYENKP